MLLNQTTWHSSLQPAEGSLGTQVLEHFGHKSILGARGLLWAQIISPAFQGMHKPHRMGWGGVKFLHIERKVLKSNKCRSF